MKVLLRVSAALTALAVAAFADRKPAPGGIAPPFDFEILLTRASEWSAEQKLPTVLDFWATWCAPCVSSLPHLNDLEQQFRGRVRFLSVTDEPPGLVSEFLRRNPISGWVAVDTDRSMMYAYRVESFPATFLIDADGVIVASGSPDQLTPDVLDSLIAGKPVKLGPPSRTPHLQPYLDDAALEARIQRVPASPDPALKVDRGAIDARGVPLGRLLALAWDVSPGRVLGPPELKEESVNASVRVAREDDSAARLLLQQALAQAFRFEARPVEEEVEVLLLQQAVDGARLQQSQGKEPYVSSGKGRYEQQATGLAPFLAMLEEHFATPVIDATGLAGNYDIELRWGVGEADSLTRMLELKLGLVLRKERRPVSVIRVSKKQDSP